MILKTEGNFTRYSRQDLNLRTRLRRPELYPLSYGSKQYSRKDSNLQYAYASSFADWCHILLTTTARELPVGLEPTMACAAGFEGLCPSNWTTGACLVIPPRLERGCPPSQGGALSI